MHTYILNKAVSIGLPILVITTAALLISPIQIAWQVLLMITFTLGYTHYFIGGYYQLAAFAKQSQYKRRMLTYWFLVVLSIGIVALAQAEGLMWLLAFVTIPYFILHGFFNETSLIRQVEGVSINPALLASLSLYMSGLTMTAFSHYSAHFNYDLSFMAEPLFLFDSVSLMYTTFKVVGGAFVLCAIGMFLFAMIRGSRAIRLSFSLWSLAVLGVGIYLVVYPFNYVYAFTFLLMYHFLTWMIHYGVRFYISNQGRFYRYVLAHLVIIILVIAVYSGFIYFNIQNPSAFVFNGNVFLFLTTVHITTSFLNDLWCKRLFGLT